MKKQIQKRADQLEPGDVIVIPEREAEARRYSPGARLVVLRRAPPAPGLRENIELAVFDTDCGVSIGAIERRTFNPEQLLDVEVELADTASYNAELFKRLDRAVNFITIYCRQKTGPFTPELKKAQAVRDHVRQLGPGVTLTPAQQHAERLAEYAERQLRELDEAIRPAWSEGEYKELRDLVDLVRPPPAPTLAEALALLAEVRADKNCSGFGVDRGRRADALLDQARRSGVL